MKTTKKALFSSVIALLLCFSMFIGSTMAWFTDSVTSGVNQIVAGNLDIEVEYKDGANWKPLQDATTLFSTDKWEPGHTEVVYLKVKNAGTLGLNYKVLVTPVSENGGVNVNGQSFKLSDYLVFGTTDPALDCPTYTREQARDAVGTTTGLADANALTKEGTMNAGVVKYLALVVYMPESVGNAANYKTGTAAPSIELGIKVVATQLGAENDSFGPDYDNGAVSAPFYTVGAYYNYFPQIVASATVVENGNTVITANGKLNKNDQDEITLATVNVPAAAVKDGVTELNLSVKPVEATNSTAQTTIQAEVDAGREVANFDVKVDGIKDNNDSSISVSVFVGKGLVNVKVYHNGIQITGATYNPDTGMVSFTTTGFSDFTVSYEPAAAAIGDKIYRSLELAIDAAQDGTTVILLKNTAEDGIVVPAGKSITLNLNGKTITGVADVKDTAVITNHGTLTINANNGGIAAKAIAVLNDGTLTVNGGTYSNHGQSETNGSYIFDTQSGGKTTLDGVKISAVFKGIRAEGAGAEVVVKNSTADVEPEYGLFAAAGQGHLTVESGTYKTAYSVARQMFDLKGSSTVSVIGGNFETAYTGQNSAPAMVVFNSDGNTFEIKGGKFTTAGDLIYYHNYNSNTVTITGGTFTADPSDYVAKGYYTAGTAAPFTVVECKEHTYQNGVCTTCNTKLVGANSDYNATIPGEATIISTQEGLNDALEAAEAGTTNTLYVGAGEFRINEVDCDGKTIVFIGAGSDKTTLKYGTTPFDPDREAGSNYCFEGSVVTFRDVMLIDGNGDDVNYEGFVRCAGLTFENCVLKSRMTYLGEGDVSFRNCTFETPKYAAWIYGSQTYNFENCLFNSPTGRFLNVYSEKNIAPVINATECRFVDSSNGTDSNAVFNIKSSSKTTLTITDCVVTGASPMYKVASANGTVVTIDGKVVYGAP